KVVATTAASMILHERSQLELEQPLAELLPAFNGGDPRRRSITLRMLLAHSSGLPAYVRLFQTARSKDELLEQAAAVRLKSDPGTRAEYSNIVFILLGVALERIASKPLDQFCQREVFAPLGLARMTFKPAPDLRPLIPPTENDTVFRRRIIQGEVND